VTHWKDEPSADWVAGSKNNSIAPQVKLGDLADNVAWTAPSSGILYILNIGTAFSMLALEACNETDPRCPASSTWAASQGRGTPSPAGEDPEAGRADRHSHRGLWRACDRPTGCFDRLEERRIAGAKRQLEAAQKRVQECEVQVGTVEEVQEAVIQNQAWEPGETIA